MLLYLGIDEKIFKYELAVANQEERKPMKKHLPRCYCLLILPQPLRLFYRCK